MPNGPRGPAAAIAAAPAVLDDVAAVAEAVVPVLDVVDALPVPVGVVDGDVVLVPLPDALLLLDVEADEVDGDDDEEEEHASPPLTALQNASAAGMTTSNTRALSVTAGKEEPGGGWESRHWRNKGKGSRFTEPHVLAARGVDAILRAIEDGLVVGACALAGPVGGGARRVLHRGVGHARLRTFGERGGGALGRDAGSPGGCEDSCGGLHALSGEMGPVRC